MHKVAILILASCILILCFAFSFAEEPKEKERVRNFCIEYMGGFSWAGDALRGNADDYGFGSPFFWMNSLNISMVTGRQGKSFTSVGFGFLYCYPMEGRSGLRLFLPDSLPSAGYATVYTLEWHLQGYSAFLKHNLRENFHIGGLACLWQAKTTEYLSSYGSMDYPENLLIPTIRWCYGGGVFCGWERLGEGAGVRLKATFRLQLGLVREFTNNSPWNWEDRLSFGLTGAFIGLGLEF